MNPRDAKALLNQYKKILGDSEKQLILGAWTSLRTIGSFNPPALNTESSETYLFEAFFGLTNVNSRLALLAHESYWVLAPDASYENVVQAEVKFEQCLNRVDQTPSGNVICPEWNQAMATLLKDPTIPLTSAIRDDWSSGRMKTILKGESIPISFFLPAELIASDFASLDSTARDGMIHDQLRAQALKYPELKFIPELMKQMPSFEWINFCNKSNFQEVNKPGIGLQIWKDATHNIFLENHGVYAQEQHYLGWPFILNGSTLAAGLAISMEIRR